MDYIDDRQYDYSRNKPKVLAISIGMLVSYLKLHSANAPQK